MENKIDEEKITTTVNDIYQGLEVTVKELQDTLPDEVDNFSANQLRRALKGVIKYQDFTKEELMGMTEREQKFSAAMMALHQATVQLEIKVIGELQKDFDMKQQQGEE